MVGEYIQFLGGFFGYIRRELFGVCVGIGVWNYFFQIVFWKLVLVLVCGNVMVFKFFFFIFVFVLLLVEIYIEVGVFFGFFNVVQGGVVIGQFLCQYYDVVKVFFIGSVFIGMKIMEMLVKGIKFVILEFGGKFLFIIFLDCDMNNVVKGVLMVNFFI